MIETRNFLQLLDLILKVKLSSTWKGLETEWYKAN